MNVGRAITEKRARLKEELRVLNLVFVRKAALLPYVSLVLGVAILLLLSTAEVSAQTAPTGKVDYQYFCAQCHGIDGAGNKESDIPGPDLTHLSKENGGKFPLQRVYGVIDGSKRIAAHKRFWDMPLWGIYFREPQNVSEEASEAKAKSRMTDLVRYIQGLQKN